MENLKMWNRHVRTLQGYFSGIISFLSLLFFVQHDILLGVIAICLAVLLFYKSWRR